MFGAADALQKVEDLLRAQDNGQCLRLLGRRDNVLEGPVLLERDLVEEPRAATARRIELGASFFSLVK